MYNTKQQQAILNYFAHNNDEYLTVSQIADYMNEQHIKIGLTTIYRNLERLIEQGAISKIKVDGMNCACFKYEKNDKETYFGLKCEKCGNIIKVNCSHLEEFYNHINTEHQFDINSNKTVFYGVCKDCLCNTDSSSVENPNTHGGCNE